MRAEPSESELGLDDVHVPGDPPIVGETNGDASPGSRRALVLVAHNLAAGRAALRRQLERKGHRVIEASGGKRALEIVRDEPVDVALVNTRMLGFDGFDVLLAWQKACAGRYVPVVLVSGISSADAATAMDLGAHDYLRGPIEAVELLARVEAAVDGKRLHDDLLRQNVELRQSSRTDPLTGLPNRRHLEEDLAALASAARRHRTSLGVLVVGIDHFERINHEEGHLGGDCVLRAVADRIKAVVREQDVICRWGGDEFLIILPSSDEEAARSLAERIRSEVLSASLVLGFQVTVSIGYAAASDPDGPALLAAADTALFRAKATGRNRVGG